MDKLFFFFGGEKKLFSFRKMNKLMHTETILMTLARIIH